MKCTAKFLVIIINQKLILRIMVFQHGYVQTIVIFKNFEYREVIIAIYFNILKLKLLIVRMFLRINSFHGNQSVKINNNYKIF